MLHNHSVRRQAGFSLVLVLCVVMALLSALVIATERSTANAGSISRYKNGSQALGAVTVALSRRERDVQLLATVGNAANFADWPGYFGHENYGVDYVGNCEVRWKIEPARTAPVSDAAGTTPIPYVVNPSPDANYVPSTSGHEQPNSTLYMFKLTAEARELAGTEVISRAQGSRYVAISREPLFRYVIFYAQNGPKGDLELGHADDVNIQGNIHSNGAIYLGGGLKVNDKIAQRGSINGAFMPTTTNIGPDANGLPVVATGVEGFFRLSKPLMFSIINGFPLTSTALTAAGTPVGDWTANGSYDVSNVIFPTETVVPPGGTALAKTGSGKTINPYRIMNASGAVTQGPTTVDNARLINTVTMKGIGAGANDSRDHARSGTRLWTAVAGSEFSNRARTSANGGISVSLSGTMANRPFEPQALTYVDADNDSTTDDHAYARPSFIEAGSGNSTFDLPATGPAIEAPGAYMNLAIGGGGNVYMVRRIGGTGWDLRLRTALTTPAPQSAQSGLIIRERPIPDTDYWPGTTGADYVDPANPRYLPFAYGKQWYPTISPFTPADVSDNLYRDRLWSGTTPSATSNISTSIANRLAAYSTGGRVTITAAANPGGSDATNGTWAGYDGTASNGIQRKHYFYRDPWRFVHMGKMTPDPSQNGLKLTYYADSAHWDEYRSNSTASALPFSGTPIAITTPANGIVGTTAGRLLFATAPATPSGNFWSARWSGFIKPTASNTYGFNVSVANTAHCVRMWVDGKLVVERTSANGTIQGQWVAMSAGRFYPVVVEFASTATGAPGNGPTIQWQTAATLVNIPSTNFYPPLSDGTFSTSTFNGVYCRIDNPQGIGGSGAQKVGLMLRPDAVASPALQGGSPYIMVGWSPTRGLFSQRRVAVATQDQRTVGRFFVGGGTSPTAGYPDAAGEVIDNPTGAATPWNRTSVLTEVWRSPTAVTGETLPPPRGSSTTGATWSTQPTLYTGTMWKDVGGGKTWTLLDNFNIGQYVGTQTWTPYIYQQVTSTIVQTVQLTPSAPGFLNSDDNCQLNIFTTPTANGLLAGGASARMGWRANGRTWWFSNATGGSAATGTTPTPTYLSRTYTNTSNGPQITGTPVSRTNYTIGSASSPSSAGSVWPLSGSNIRINKNGTVTNATPADIATVIGLTVVDIRNGASIPAPTLTYPADALATGATAATAPTPVNMTNGGLGRTFAVTRSNTTYTFDLRSWVTGSATIPAAPQAQYLPRNAGWPASWTGTAAWPTGWGLRPDVWLTSATAPVLTSPASPVLASATATAAGAVTGGDGYSMTDDVKPTGWTTAKEVWLGVERSGTNLVCRYYIGNTKPSSMTGAGWTTLGNALDISAWGPAMLAGPCVQSGSISTPTTATFTDLQVQTSLPAPNNVIDATDWDNTSGSTDDLTKYLISQYQVFFGTSEITEDFFLYRDPSTGARLADEQWFYDPREFWSQSRWWDHTTALGARVEKDAFTAPSTTFTSTAFRELLAKTTVLTLNLGAVQGYLTTRQLGDAVADRITGVGSISTVSNPTSLLAATFNGLIYAVRTNRYPWNPNSNPLLPATQSGTNPWSPIMADGLLSMVNSVTAPGATAPGIANGSALDGLSHADLLVSGVHVLQPYALPQAPAFMPTRFHHGVRIINAANVNWNYPGAASSATNSKGGKNWTYSSPPQFGSCRLSIVTPNQLFIQGSLNVDQHSVTYRGTTSFKPTPLAIMGDQITLLSNAWNDTLYQVPGLTVSNTAGPSAVTGAGILSCSTIGAPATTTYYQAGIVTNNIPTTQDRVREGQAAPFVDTVNFLENWNGCTMGYLGSLVVLDSRRYTQSFLLDSYKPYGTTPFGIAGSGAGDPWLAFFGVAAPDWVGQSPPVYSEPTRTYSFNYDFLTSEGTPPFVPFGVSSTGAGGWARIVQ